MLSFDTFSIVVQHGNMILAFQYLAGMLLDGKMLEKCRRADLEVPNCPQITVIFHLQINLTVLRERAAL